MDILNGDTGCVKVQCTDSSNATKQNQRYDGPKTKNPSGNGLTYLLLQVLTCSTMRDINPSQIILKTKAIKPPPYLTGGIIAQKSFQGMAIKCMV